MYTTGAATELLIVLLTVPSRPPVGRVSNPPTTATGSTSPTSETASSHSPGGEQRSSCASPHPSGPRRRRSVSVRGSLDSTGPLCGSSWRPRPRPAVATWGRGSGTGKDADHPIPHRKAGVDDEPGQVVQSRVVERVRVSADGIVDARLGVPRAVRTTGRQDSGRLLSGGCARRSSGPGARVQTHGRTASIRSWGSWCTASRFPFRRPTATKIVGRRTLV